jgi:hypothetical protein
MTTFTILTREAVPTSGAFCTLERCTTNGQPATLIAKTPREGPINDVGTALGLYVREARFYAELADTVPMRVPRCYDPGDGVAQPLLLEDLSSLRAGDQIAGLTIEQAQMILRGAAALHAQHWETATQDWLFELDNPVNVQMLEQVTTAGVPALRERFSSRFGSAVLDAAADVCARIADVLTACSQGPRTIAHGDLRLDNLLFDGRDAVYLDWQTVAHTRGTHDVAYLLSGSIDSGTLSRSWEDLLRGYHQTLTAAGVEYSWPDCLAHYRQNVLYSFVPALATLSAVFVEGDRGADLADTIGERILRHAAEIDAFATLT